MLTAWTELPEPRGLTARCADGTDGLDGADGATGVIVEDSGTQQGTGVTTINFGANISATVTGTEATVVGQAGGGGGGLSAVTSDATLDGDGTASDPLGVADGGVGTTQLGDDAVTQAKLADNSVHAPQIGANAVGSSEITADAVGTSELSDDAVTEAKIADSAVGFQQLAANSVREPEIQANAVGHSEMADAAVGVAELRDDAAERLCPDPGTGTSGQVCARNAAGDAYELVTSTGGGGGTTVTANPGSGTTDLTTVTIGATDYTIAPSATAVTAFECVMTDIAATTYAASTNILECDGTPTINEGAFVVEDASGTDTTDRVVIQEAGFYELITSVYIESIASTLRTTAVVGFQVERGGTDAIYADEGTGYVRDGLEVSAIDHTSFVELEVDDRIGVVLRSAAAAATMAVDGSKSFFAIIRTGGPEGPRGPAGTGSDIDSVDVSYAPDVRVWELTIEQTGGGATFTESTTIPIATQATFGLIEMANGPEVEAGAAINRALAPSTITFLNPNQMASGNAASLGDVPTADGAGRITWEAQSGGGGTGTGDITAVNTANNSGLGWRGG